MNNWTKVPFETLYLEPSRNGVNRPRRVRGSGYKMINMGELFAYERIKNPPMELVPLNEEEIRKYGVLEGDLLFARQSLVASGAGKCSIALYVPEITTFEGHLIRVRLDKVKADPLFYYYYFSSHIGMGNVQSLVMQVAAAGIRGSELAKLPIPYPPLPTQRKIAAILSAYDDLIENNTRRIQILEEMAQALYRHWFVDYKFPGHEDVRMVDSGTELGEIPQGWKIVSYTELLGTYLGGGWGSEEPKENEVNPVVVIRGTDFTSVKSGGIIVAPTRFITKDSLAKRRLKEGDIVVENSVNASSRCVGTSLLITEGVLRLIGGDSICASFCKNFRLKEPKLAPLIQLHMKYLYSTEKMAFYQNVATNGIGNFQATRFVASEMIAIPEDDDLLDNMLILLRDLSTSAYAEQIANLRATRDLLLPRLVSGEVDVSEVEI